MSSSSIEVFWGSGSTPAWRVLLGFALKGLPYESRLLSFSARETRSPAFLAINPRGKVPAIREGELVLNESLAILAWLEQRAPEGPALFGRTPAEAGRIWRDCMEYESHGNPTFSALVRPLLFGGHSAEGVQAALPAVIAELDRLAAAVARGDMGAGTASAADIVWYCGLRFLDRGLSRPAAAAYGLEVLPLRSRWPGLGALVERVEAIPGFEGTVPPHWLEGEAPCAVTLA